MHQGRRAVFIVSPVNPFTTLGQARRTEPHKLFSARNANFSKQVSRKQVWAWASLGPKIVIACRFTIGQVSGLMDRFGRVDVVNPFVHTPSYFCMSSLLVALLFTLLLNPLNFFSLFHLYLFCCHSFLCATVTRQKYSPPGINKVLWKLMLSLWSPGAVVCFSVSAIW